MAVGKVEEQQGNARFEGRDTLCVEEELDGTLIAGFRGGVGRRVGSGGLIIRSSSASLRLRLRWL